MAELLQQYDFVTRARKTSGRYVTWTDGRIWRLTQGVDFYCTRNSLEQGLTRVARQMGKRAQWRVESESPLVIVVTAVPREAQ